MKNMNKYELLKQSWLFVNHPKSGQVGKECSSGPKLLFKGFRFPAPRSLSDHELCSTVNQGEHTKQRPVLNVNETNRVFLVWEEKGSAVM